MQRTHRFRGLGVSVLVLLALVAGACGNSDEDDGNDAGGGGNTDTSEVDQPGETPDGDVDLSEFVPIEGVPGVTDDEIRYSIFGTFSESNPLGTCTLECMAHGVQAYFNMRNAEGGVYGRDLVLDDLINDELAKNQEKALEIVSAGDTFGAFSATQIASGWPTITEAGMPLYVWNIHPVESQDPAVFGNAPAICQTCESRLIPHIASLEGATKAGVMGYGISENSKISAANNRDSLESGGVDVVFFDDTLDFGLANGIAPQVTAMKDAGVEIVIASIDLNGQKTLAQEMERQGMGDVPMIHLNTYNQSFVEEAGDLFDGDYVNVGFRPYEAETAGTGMEDYFEWMDDLGEEPDELSTVGWIVADMAFQGLAKAGPEFDQAKVIAASNTITDFTADGIIPPIDWSRQHEPPTPDDLLTNGSELACTAVVQITDDATFEVVGDPAEPWLCFPNDDLSVTEPTSVNFT